MKPYVNITSEVLAPRQPWEPFCVRAADWQAGLDEVLAGSASASGRREIALRHPRSSATAPSLAPGIDVRFGALAPGEVQIPLRCNATQFGMVLDGSAVLDVGGLSLPLAARDSWVVPGMQSHALRNTGVETVRYVLYSNAALLRRLESFYEDERQVDLHARGANGAFERARDIAGSGHVLNDTGACILPYEYLVDPDTTESSALVWHWHEIVPHLPAVMNLQQGYNGRALWVLYNPATERKVGTTPCFFASIAVPAKNLVTPSHLHMSAAINFILEGEGYSDVEGTHLEWSAGDIMLSAPSWSRHRHGVREARTVILTIQDHPLHIGMESLLWQENMPDGPILVLGTGQGFNTNRGEMAQNKRG